MFLFQKNNFSFTMTILISFFSYSLHLVEHFFTFQVALGKFFHPFLSGGGTFKVLLSKCHLRYLTQKNITFFCPFLTEKIRIFEKYFGKGLGRDYLWPTLAIRVAQSKQGVYFLIHLSVWKKPTWYPPKLGVPTKVNNVRNLVITSSHKGSPRQRLI